MSQLIFQLIKPSAEAGFPRLVAIAKICKDAGAKFITNINAPITVAPPDIYARGASPWRKVNLKINPIGAAVGPWNRYQNYKATATTALFVPDIDVAAVGGMVLPEHAIELMMLGARHIGISSGLYWNGRKVISQFIRFLDKFMDDQGYSSVDELFMTSIY